MAGRKTEALKLFDALEAKGDGWLLPPEARLDRALCLAGTAASATRRAGCCCARATAGSRTPIDRLLEKVAQGR